MPGFLIQVGATIKCPHGGTVNIVPVGPRVTAGGPPVALLSWAYPIAGCPFQIPTPAGPKPQPCVRVQWLPPTAALRVKVAGQPVLVRSSTGLCLSAEQIPQGPPIIVQTQMRTKGM
jgi:hypothetical protein